MKSGMRIGVVGAGIYGVSIALKLSENHTVDLYERNDDILTSATMVNQFRLHRGYHYPRSPETISSALSSVPIFKSMYPQTTIKDTDNYYCIASKDSLTSAKSFKEVMDNFGLEYKATSLKTLNNPNISLCVKVNEDIIDYKLLYESCWRQLKNSNVNVRLNTMYVIKMSNEYDKTIVCTYSSNNNYIQDSNSKREYQFELCEKIVLKLPKVYKNKSIVIMDGPFMCIDPYGSTKYHLMGNVVHAIHSSNVGINKVLPSQYESLIDKGLIRNPSITNFDKFIDSASEYFKDIEKSEHIGSMYTYRVVLPNKDKTDERPAIVEHVDENTYTVFAGKIANSAEVASNIERIIFKE